MNGNEEKKQRLPAEMPASMKKRRENNMKSILEEVTSYRVKVKKDGREIVNVPGILALPGVLMAPKLSIVGTVAASLLGCSIHLENDEGKTVDVGKAVKDTAGTVADAAKETARSVKAEIDRVWDEMSAEDPEDCPAGEEDQEKPADEAEAKAVEETVEELEKHEADDIPTIHVENPNKPE